MTAKGRNARAVLDLPALLDDAVVKPRETSSKRLFYAVYDAANEYDEEVGAEEGCEAKLPERRPRRHVRTMAGGDFPVTQDPYGEALGSDDDSYSDEERYTGREAFVLSVDERLRPRYVRLSADNSGSSCGEECDAGAREPPPSPEGASSEDEGPRPSEAIADADVRSLLAVLPQVLTAQLAPHIAAAAAPLEEVTLDVGRPAALRFGDGSVVRLPPAASVEECLASLAAGRSRAAATAAHEPLRFRADGRMALPRSLHRVSAVHVPGEAGGTERVAGLTLRVGRHVDGTAEALLDVLAANTRPLRNRGRGRSAGGGIDDALALLDAATGGSRAGSAAAPRSLLLLGPPGSGKTTLLRCVNDPQIMCIAAAPAAALRAGSVLTFPLSTLRRRQGHRPRLLLRPGPLHRRGGYEQRDRRRRRGAARLHRRQPPRDGPIARGAGGAAGAHRAEPHAAGGHRGRDRH